MKEPALIDAPMDCHIPDSMAPGILCERCHTYNILQALPCDPCKRGKRLH